VTRSGTCRNSFIRSNPEESRSLEWLDSVLSVGDRISLSARVSRIDARGRPRQLFGWCALKDGRALLIPVDSAAAGIGSLRLYRPQKLGPRVSRALLILGLRAGLARYVLPGAGALAQGHSLTDGGSATFLLEYLREAFGHSDTTFGIYFGAPGPVRKPVVAVISRQGQMLGFAKIGWNEQTVSLVENEKRTLEALAVHPFNFGRFPRVTHFARWNGKCLLITEPLPFGGREDRKLRPLHIRFLTEVARIGQVRRRFTESGLFSRLRVRLHDLRGSIPAVHATLVERALDFLKDSLGSTDIPWVWRLGDFTPWNTRIERREHRIACIDVEYAEKDGIPGWDLFHFLSQTAGKNVRTANIVSAVQRDSLAYFEALCIRPQLIPTLYVAYLSDLYTLWAQLWARNNRPLTADAADAMARLVGLLDQSIRKQATERTRA
jgi:hypothetical protein